MTAELEAVKTYVLREFLAGESSDELTETTPLISGGIIDSIGTLKLVAFLEETFDVDVEAHEMDETNLGTLGSIVSFIQQKKNS